MIRSASFTGSPEQIILRVPNDYPTVQAALTALQGDGIVEVTDSGRHLAPAGLKVAVNTNGHIELRAADGFRPTLVVGAEITVTGGAESAFDLNGLVVTYDPPATGAPAPAALVDKLARAGTAVGVKVAGALLPARL